MSRLSLLHLALLHYPISATPIAFGIITLSTECNAKCNKASLITFGVVLQLEVGTMLVSSSITTQVAYYSRLICHLSYLNTRVLASHLCYAIGCSVASE